MHLGDGLAFNVLRPNAAAQGFDSKFRERRTEVFAIPAKQRCNRFGRRSRFTIHQHDVAAYAQARISSCDLNRRIERRPTSHQSRRGQRARTVEFFNRPVDARRLAEIVSVENQARGHLPIVEERCEEERGGP